MRFQTLKAVIWSVVSCYKKLAQDQTPYTRFDVMRQLVFWAPKEATKKIIQPVVFTDWLHYNRRCYTLCRSSSWIPFGPHPIQWHCVSTDSSSEAPINFQIIFHFIYSGDSLLWLSSSEQNCSPYSSSVHSYRHTHCSSQLIFGQQLVRGSVFMGYDTELRGNGTPAFQNNAFEYIYSC